MTRARSALLAGALAACVGAGCSGPAPAPGGPPPATAVDGAVFEADGVRLWYRTAGPHGDGAPVVFLHGGPGQGSSHFDALVGPRLEPALPMVYLDQRGSGRSERPASEDYAIERLVADVERLRQHLGVPEVALLGHSFGGLLALEYAAAHPERTAAVVFVAGLYDVPSQCALRLARLADLRPDVHARAVADSLRADGSRRSDCDLELAGFESEDEREAYAAATYFPYPATQARIDSVEAAHGTRNTGEMGRALFGSGVLDGYRFTGYDRVTAPVLVVAGGLDGAARPEGLRRLAERLPNARYVEVPEAGHFVYLDAPDAFTRHAIPFVLDAE